MNKRVLLVFGIFVIVTVGFLFWKSWREKDDLQLAGDTKLRLQLQWFDQAQFIGFYVASHKLYYKDKGLQVDIIPGGFNINPIMKVRMGDADIGITTADQLLLQRAEGHDIKAIGNVFNKSIACFISRKELNIHSPQDLIGKKVGVYRGFDTENILMSILNKHSIDKNQLNIRDAGHFSAFITNEIDVFPSYLINEPILAEDKGISINILYPDDFGVQFYSDTIFVSGDFLNANRDILKRFLHASAEGWAYAERNPEEALQIMYSYTRSSSTSDLSSSSKHQSKMLKSVLEHIRGGSNDKMFFMDRTRWDSMERSLFKIGRLKTQGHVGDLCDFKLANEGK